VVAGNRCCRRLRAACQIYGGFLVIGVFSWLLFRRDGRAALKTPWPWAAALLAACIFAPNIWWNATHDWVSYLKQGSRVTSFDVARAAQFLAALVFWLILLPGWAFVEHVVSGRVQANWPAVIYPACCLAAATLPEKSLLRWAGPAIGLGFAMTLVAYAQALAAPFPIPAAWDPSALQLSGWPQLAGEVAAAGGEFVTADDYATDAELAFYAPAGVAVAGIGARWHYFGFTPAKLAGGIMLTRHSDTICTDPVGTLTRNRGGEVITTYRLCRISAPVGAFLLPRP
jgi:hypothetical protein